MADKTEDRRVQRTKKQLRDALIALLGEKTLDRITTTELCEKAGINRNTFYVYYKSPAELLQYIEGVFFREIIASFMALFESPNLQKALTLLCEKVLENREMCFIIDRHGESKIMTDIVELVREPTYERWREEGFSGTTEDMAIIYSFVTAGCKNSLVYWLKSGTEKTPAQMARFLETQGMYGLSRFMKNKKL